MSEKLLSCVQFFATPWILQLMQFSRSEYWSEKPLPPPGDFPNPGIKPGSPTSDSLPTEPQGKPNFFSLMVVLASEKLRKQMLAILLAGYFREELQQKMSGKGLIWEEPIGSCSVTDGLYSSKMVMS